MYVAGLVGVLDTTASPPRLKRVGIFSCRANGLTTAMRTEFAFDICYMHAGSYQEARERLRKQVREDLSLAWVRPFLGESDR